MKKKRFTEAQIASILNEQEAGKSVKDISREHGISDATFYNWKAKYGGMQVSDVKKMKELEEENSHLKRIVANLTLEIDAIFYTQRLLPNHFRMASGHPAALKGPTPGELRSIR